MIYTTTPLGSENFYGCCYLPHFGRSRFDRFRHFNLALDWNVLPVWMKYRFPQ